MDPSALVTLDAMWWAHLKTEGLQPVLRCMMPIRLEPRASHGANSTTLDALQDMRDQVSHMHASATSAACRDSSVITAACQRCTC